MQSRRTRVPRRAIVTALALYALLVQAFLAGFAPAKAHHMAAATTILCSQEASGDSSPERPVAQDEGCCLAACFAPMAAPAAPTSTSAAWPSREAANLVWARAAVAVGARAAWPPVNARGPPAV
jgi:hypothetical protein